MIFEHWANKRSLISLPESNSQWDGVEVDAESSLTLNRGSRHGTNQRVLHAHHHSLLPYTYIDPIPLELKRRII